MMDKEEIVIMIVKYSKYRRKEVTKLDIYLINSDFVHYTSLYIKIDLIISFRF